MNHLEGHRGTHRLSHALTEDRRVRLKYGSLSAYEIIFNSKQLAK